MEDDQDRRVSGFILRAEDGSTHWLGPDDVATDLRGMVGQQLPGGCQTSRRHTSTSRTSPAGRRARPPARSG
jgi:hypothetical protein